MILQPLKCLLLLLSYLLLRPLILNSFFPSLNIAVDFVTSEFQGTVFLKICLLDLLLLLLALDQHLHLFFLLSFLKFLHFLLSQFFLCFEIRKPFLGYFLIFLLAYLNPFFNHLAFHLALHQFSLPLFFYFVLQLLFPLFLFFNFLFHLQLLFFLKFVLPGKFFFYFLFFCQLSN